MRLRFRTAFHSITKAVLALSAMALAGSPSYAQETPAWIFSANDPVPTFISREGAGNRPGDGALAAWALEAWRKASGGTLSFTRVEEQGSLLRLYWVSAQSGLYGEMRPILVQGRRGAAVFVRPETEGLGGEIAAHARVDSLFRDPVVYLTCLHEVGHALGLDHTAEYDDVMFFFGYGGDILNYFERYRRRLQKREDIAGNWGLSDADIRRIRQIYPQPNR
jgi:hypothetical protein